MHFTIAVSRTKKSLTCWSLFCRESEMGYYMLCGQTGTKLSKPRNKWVNYKGKVPKEVISPTERCYILGTLHYCWHTGHYIDMVSSRNLEWIKTGKCAPHVCHSRKPNPSQNAMLVVWENLGLLVEILKTSKSWHNDAKNFCSGRKGALGLVNLSPAWF